MSKKKNIYKIGPGDILLYHGSRFDHWLTRVWEWSDWDHIGIVVEYKNNTCILESVHHPSKNILDVISKRPKSGVRLVTLKSSLKCDKNSIVCIRPMEPKLSTKLNQKLVQFYMDNRHREFEKSYSEMFWSSCIMCGENKTNFKTVFCSELIAEALKTIGVGKRGLCYSAGNYSPKKLSIIDLKDKRYRYKNSIYQIKPSKYDYKK